MVEKAVSGLKNPPTIMTCTRDVLRLILRLQMADYSGILELFYNYSRIVGYGQNLWRYQ